MDGLEKRIVYIIRSDVDPSRHYVGITHNIDARLEPLMDILARDDVHRSGTIVQA